MPDIHAIDVSNYNDLGSHIAIATSYGTPPGLVVVRGSLEDAARRELAQQQCQGTLDRNLLLDIYGWAYATYDDPDEFVARLVEAFGGFNPRRWWIDCEEDTRPGAFKSWYASHTDWNIDWLLRAVDAFQRRNLKIGIYTGHWFWTVWMANTYALSDLPLWNSTDTKTPDRNLGWPYGGWQSPYAGVQYDLSGPDRNVFDAALYADDEQPPVDEGDTVTAEQTRIAKEEVLRTINEALAVPKLPPAARTALRDGAKPATETIIRLGGGDPDSE